MIRILTRGSDTLQTVEVGSKFKLPPDAVWIELLHPTRVEELAVEAAVDLDLPTREEMAEIEISSRLYHEDGATFMTATLICGSDQDNPVPGPVTFVLSGERLITIRYVHPRSFQVFADKAERQPDLRASGAKILLGLLETVVDRTADMLERVSVEVEDTARTIFTPARSIRFRPILNRLARSQSLNGMARESLVSLSRLISFAMLAEQFANDREAREELRSLQRDVQSLTEHSSYVSGNLTFLLDAALGLINIEQNEITKVFSIYAVVLLPPTLIATWYGMNFRHMPELDWVWAYPAALAAMVLSALIPFLWFKHKGWL